MKRLASVLGDRSALDWAGHHHDGLSSEVSMAWARTTNDDNYRGGDDNYGSEGEGEAERCGAWGSTTTTAEVTTTTRGGW